MTPSPDPRRGRLTPTQAGLWSLEQALAPSSAALNMAYALELTGALDARALRQGLDALVARHEPLRTTYPEVDGTPVAQVHPANGAPLEEVDLRSLDDAARQAEVIRRVRDNAQRPFELARGPLMRATLLALGPERHVLLLAFHHICADGWTLEIFCRELSALYAGFRQGRPAELKPLSAQCLDHAQVEAGWLSGPEAEKQRQWWRSYLAGVPLEALRPPGPGSTSGANTSPVMARRVVPLAPELMDELRKLARAREASVYMVLLAALEVVLTRWTGASEAVVGTLVVNRPTLGSSRMLGAHYNTALMRVRLEGASSLGEVLMRATEEGAAALEHARLPFAEIAALLERERGVPRGQVPWVMLLQDRYPLHHFSMEGLEVSGLQVDDGPWRTAMAPSGALVFFVREDHARFTLSVFHRPEVLDEETVARLVASLQEVLMAMVYDLGTAPSDVELPLVGPPPPPEASRPGPVPALVSLNSLSPVDALSPILPGLHLDRMDSTWS
jgi:hypothetical protein